MPFFIYFFWIIGFSNTDICHPHRKCIGFLNEFIYLFIYLLSVLGLLCCARAFSSCGERGLLFVAVRRLLIAVASLVAEHGL